jgi:hypothetical protein
MTPPLVIDREQHDALMKDPLYARRLTIGIEIGRVIVNGEKICQKANV